MSGLVAVRAAGLRERRSVQWVELSFEGFALKHILGKSQMLRGLRQDVTTIHRRFLTGRSAKIRRYFMTAQTAALHIGASRAIQGWLNTDLEPRTNETLFLDATKPFPFPDDCFEFIYSEHMIEHVPRDGAAVMLAECRRTLKPGGVLRLATPDLSFLLKLYYDPGSSGRAYMQWIADRFLCNPAQAEPTFVINNAFRAWGHEFLYDADTLTADLRRSGFKTVNRVEYGQSSHEMLCGVEQHGADGYEEMVRLETMVFEAS